MYELDAGVDGILQITHNGFQAIDLSTDSTKDCRDGFPVTETSLLMLAVSFVIAVRRRAARFFALRSDSARR